MDIDKATATQLANIEKRTGKTLAQLQKVIEKSGLTKHGEIVAMLKQDLGMGHGDANTLVQLSGEPNALADRTPIREGLAVRAQNYSGSLASDRSRAVGQEPARRQMSQSQARERSAWVQGVGPVHVGHEARVNTQKGARW